MKKEMKQKTDLYKTEVRNKLEMMKSKEFDKIQIKLDAPELGETIKKSAREVV